MVGLGVQAADLTCLLEVWVSWAVGLSGLWQGAGGGMGLYLMWWWDKPRLHFYSVAKNKYFHSHVFVWGSVSEGTETS